MICEKCGHKQIPKRREPLDWGTVKVGDVLVGYSGKIIMVTAIGDKRFLYTDSASSRERSGSKYSYQANWRRKIKEEE